MILVAPLAQRVKNVIADVVDHTLGLVAAQLLHVVDDDDAGDGAGGLVLQADIVVFRDVHPVGGAHEGLALSPFVRADEIAVHLIFARIDLQDAGVLRLSLEQPFPRELGQHLRNSRVEPALLLAAHVEKHVVAPDDARVVQAEDGDRQREIHQRLVLRVLGPVGNGFHILRELPLLDAPGNERIDQQHDDDRRLGRRKVILLEIQRRRGEGYQEEQMDPYAGFRKALELPFVLSVVILIGFHHGPPQK